MYRLQIDKPYLQAYLDDIYVDWNAEKPLYKEAQCLFRFNGFSVPNELIRLIEHGCFDYFRGNKALYICVDHSFVEELTESGQDINIIFIDHHLAEKQNVKYASNARMMAENYPDLMKYLVNVIPYFNSIVVLMHNDLDGLASGIIMKSIINDIFDENRHEGINVQSGVAFAKILGSYGDIDSDKLKTLETFFHKSLHANIDKKFESIRKNIGTFFKATRAIHDSLFYIRNYQDIVNEKNFLLSGGAGSGKTYSLIQTINLIKSLYNNKSIACITYTNVAVNEIKNRVIDNRNLEVLTIHDFLWKNIKKYHV